MKTETKPEAAGVAAALIYFALLLWVIVGSHMGCAHAPDVQRPVAVAGVTRTPLEAADATVFVITSCDRAGSGVLINTQQILTAYHVINCGPMGTSQPASEIDVELADGTRMRATIEVADVARDLARLRVKPVPYVKSARIVQAKKGDLACAVTATPERAFRCGRVTSFDTDRRSGDLITDHKDLWLGNSGSGVYNEHGEIIGLAVGTYFCSEFEAQMHQLLGVRPEKMCGARVSSILDSPVKP